LYKFSYSGVVESMVCCFKDCEFKTKDTYNDGVNSFAPIEILPNLGDSINVGDISINSRDFVLYNGKAYFHYYDSKGRLVNLNLNDEF
jgi:hypothetical protein